MCIIDRITSLLKARGASQIEFSEALSSPKVTKQTITDWKSGKSKSYYEYIPEIANYFGVSCDYLLTGKEHIVSGIDLTDSEIKLLAEFRKLDFRGCTAVMNTIISEQDRMEIEKNSARDTNVG